MRVNVLLNTHVKLKYNKIHNLILINKAVSIITIRSVIIVTVCLWMPQSRELVTNECFHCHFTLQAILWLLFRHICIWSQKVSLGMIMSVHLSACISMAPTGWFVLKFHTGYLYENLLRKYRTLYVKT